MTRCLILTIVLVIIFIALLIVSFINSNSPPSPSPDPVNPSWKPTLSNTTFGPYSTPMCESELNANYTSPNDT